MTRWEGRLSVMEPDCALIFHGLAILQRSPESEAFGGTQVSHGEHRLLQRGRSAHQSSGLDVARLINNQSDRRESLLLLNRRRHRLETLIERHRGRDIRVRA